MLVIEGYDILAPIARGGVYLGCDRRTGETVALKLLDRRYARITEQPIGHHQNLLEVRGSGRTEQNVPYLVLEYLHGENLAALAARGRLPIDAIIAIGGQIAAGLATLHAAGIVHGDVKLDNVIVLDEPYDGWRKLKVIDYGMSQRADEIVPDETAISGTPACMAPEQWLGAPCAKSDVYSFGCSLYELVTGDNVFGGTLHELMIAHTRRHPPRASWLRTDIPADLERLILRMLAKHPAERPTMTEVAAQLPQRLPPASLR